MEHPRSWKLAASKVGASLAFWVAHKKAAVTRAHTKKRTVEADSPRSLTRTPPHRREFRFMRSAPMMANTMTTDTMSSTVDDADDDDDADTRGRE